jgi:hypothetical protein
VPVPVARIRVEARQLRELDWSYRRIAHRLVARHQLWPESGPAKTGKAWSYWEGWPAKGGRAPSAAVLWRLAELYQCRPGDLLDGPDFGELDRCAGGSAPGAADGCRCRLPGAGEDISPGLLPLAAALARASATDAPPAALIEERLAALVTGWVPAA